MAMRSFLLAGVLAVIAAAALAGWWFLGGGPDRDALDDDPFVRGDYERIEGSLYDEFGDPGQTRGQAGDDEIRITVGQGQAGRADGSALDGPPRFAGTPAPDEPEPWWRPSGGAPFVPEPPRELPRATPSERVEADCRDRGGRSWACRCLVRVARARLNEAEFEFLSLAEEPGEPAARLTRSGLAPGALPAVSAALVGVHVEAGQRCGTGLTP
ncbi:hypothetical protein F1654_08410 [Alkalicaulis satelles]|uniref:Uncharacterized protein n=1 Tax=Alkalicaulis satelles TaxID=2609175 RepID=A0A5M6ZGD6_9PROT|nr:hypothetical protein [Alkalicaulis satelles]KAA5803812.1 hypothetical protein F1654_08410 [Alkalicaulis satelles]